MGRQSSKTGTKSNTPTGAAATPRAGEEAPAGAGATQPNTADPGGHSSRSATALDNVREDLRFDALRNSLYHQAMRSFGDSLHRWQMFVVILSGSGAVASLASNSPVLTGVLAFVAAISAASDAAFDWAGKAREHAYLARRYFELLADIEVGCRSDDECRTVRGRLIRLYAEERPPMRAVDAIAYNAAQESLYGDDAKRLKVKWFHSGLRYFLPFAHDRFPQEEAKS